MKALLHDVSSSLQPGAHCGQLEQALAQLERIVLDGVQHGFFRCSITCAIQKGGRRELVIEAGKSHKFTIPEDEALR